MKVNLTKNLIWVDIQDEIFVLNPNLFPCREARGPQHDLLVEYGQKLASVEIKSSATISEDFQFSSRRFALTKHTMWIIIAIKFHMKEVRYENCSDDP